MPMKAQKKPLGA